MFTGIVEAQGTIESIARAEPEQSVVRVEVSTTLDLGLPIGASIAVDGVCLTIVERDAGLFAADLGPETLILTTLGSLEAGGHVHLERPLRMGDSLGGHLVSGHVDTMGTVAARRENGGALELDILVPEPFSRVLAPKGSIAVDGVSLTINALSDSGAGTVVSLTLIPHTLKVTKLGGKPVGSAVNIETDLIAKHLERLVSPYVSAAESADRLAGTTPSRPLSIETLRRHGFVR
jgi:riboflavin synthase